MKKLLFVLLFTPFLSYSQLTSFVVRGDTLFALDPSSGVYTQLTKNVPPMIGQSGKILSTNGTLYQWITPSYVNVSDSASMLSPYVRSNVAAATYQLAGNYLTGNQSITLSGDISGSGTTAITTAIGSGKVTNAMLAGSIAYSKLALTGTILNADLAGSIADAKILSAATWNAKQSAITTGTTAQYFRGDLSLATFPTTTAAFTNSTDKNFVTDAQSTIIGNTSGTNTGDNAVNSLYSGLVSNATHTGDATGSTALTVVKINGTSLAGLATGLLKNTTTTGVPSIAVQSDITALLGAGSITNTMLANAAVANLSGTNSGDNAANTTYANDFRAANFVAGTNYLAPGGNGSALTGITESQVTNLTSDLAAKQATLVSATNIKTVNGTTLLGSGDIGVSGASTTTYINLASNFSSSSVSEATVTGWSFAVTSGKAYRIEVTGLYQTAATTTGGELGFFLTASGAGTISGSAEGAIVNTAAATSLSQQISAIGAADAAGSNLITTGVTASNSPHYIKSTVIFICTVSGTFNVGWATEVAASAAQLNAGSALIYQVLN